MIEKFGIIAGGIASLFVIGSFIFGNDYIKDYINKQIENDIHITKEVVEKNTKIMENNNIILQERNKSLKEIQDYFIIRLSDLDYDISDLNTKLKSNNDMIAISTSQFRVGYQLANDNILKNLQQLQNEKKVLLVQLSKFIDNNPLTIQKNR